MNIAQGQRQRPSSQMLGRVRLRCGDHRKEGGHLTGILHPARALPKHCHTGTLLRMPDLSSDPKAPGCETGLQLRGCAPAPVLSPCYQLIKNLGDSILWQNHCIYKNSHEECVPDRGVLQVSTRLSKARATSRMSR